MSNIKALIIAKGDYKGFIFLILSFLLNLSRAEFFWPNSYGASLFGFNFLYCVVLKSDYFFMRSSSSMILSAVLSNWKEAIFSLIWSLFS